MGVDNLPERGYPEADPSQPGRGDRILEPTFHTCLTRATLCGWMNGYSRFTAFNADGSRILVRSGDLSAWPRARASGDWYLLDAKDLGAPPRALRENAPDPVNYPNDRRAVSGDSAAPRWHGTDADTLFYLSGSTLMQYCVSKDLSDPVFDVASEFDRCGGIAQLTLGGDEGDASAGSRFWGFQVKTNASCGDADPSLVMHFVTYDRETRESWVHTLPKGVGMPNNSSMSLTGKYFVANFTENGAGPCPEGGAGTMEDPCGLMAYCRTFSDARMVHRDAGHYDEALSRDRRDLVVVNSKPSDMVEAIDIDTFFDSHSTPVVTSIAKLKLDEDHVAYDYHISGNNWAAPGWVLLSEDSQWLPLSYVRRDPDDPAPPWHYLYRQIVAIEIAPFDKARVIHLAHHRTRGTQYWAKECHASVNADFTRVAFHSNWYGDDSESAVSLFFLELPTDLLSWAEQFSSDLPDEIR